MRYETALTFTENEDSRKAVKQEIQNERRVHEDAILEFQHRIAVYSAAVDRRAFSLLVGISQHGKRIHPPSPSVFCGEYRF